MSSYSVFRVFDVVVAVAAVAAVLKQTFGQSGISEKNSRGRNRRNGWEIPSLPAPIPGSTVHRRTGHFPP